jgi:glyoxylase-like metal-dependent hydrolase (beta-lactamase superfamily II)
MRKTPFYLLLAATLVPVGAWLTQAQQQPPPPSKIEKVRDDLYVISGDGGNTTLYLTDDGVIMVDAKFERDHDDVMSKLKSVTSKPVKYLISTHPHGDHTGGNEKMRADTQVKIIGQRNLRKDMVEQKLPGVPEITYTDELSLNLGGKEVIARHFAPAHTDGDTVVYFPALRMVAMGDTFNTGTFGVHIDYKSNGSLIEWDKTMDGALKWDFDAVIPGHGPMATRADLMKFRDSIQATRTRVRGMIREGKTPDDVAKVLIGEFGWNPAGIGIRGDIPGLMAELKP